MLNHAPSVAAATAIITDLGQAQQVINAAGAVVAHVPRYGVWQRTRPGTPHHVIDTGDDLELLAKRHGLPAVAIPIGRPEECHA